MSKKYKKPPVIEALCEFQFVTGQPWDLTIPGLVYERVKEEFTDKQQQVGVGFKIQKTEEGLEHRVIPAPPRIQLFRKDKTALIQIGPDLLAINHLVPYPTWQKFKPMVLEALKVYKDIAKPRAFKKIILRYINRIEIKGELIELSDYFDFYPYVSKALPQLHTNLINRIEIPYKDGRDFMTLTIATASPERPEVLSIILDIEYVMAAAEGIKMDEFDGWLEHAHSEIERTFEVCITDKSRMLFEEVK